MKRCLLLGLACEQALVYFTWFLCISAISHTYWQIYSFFAYCHWYVLRTGPKRLDCIFCLELKPAIKTEFGCFTLPTISSLMDFCIALWVIVAFTAVSAIYRITLSAFIATVCLIGLNHGLRPFVFPIHFFFSLSRNSSIVNCCLLFSLYCPVNRKWTAWKMVSIFYFFITAPLSGWDVGREEFPNYVCLEIQTMGCLHVTLQHLEELGVLDRNSVVVTMSVTVYG